MATNAAQLMLLIALNHERNVSSVAFPPSYFLKGGSKARLTSLFLLLPGIVPNPLLVCLVKVRRLFPGVALISVPIAPALRLDLLGQAGPEEKVHGNASVIKKLPVIGFPFFT
jgi:hypothetical protein